jgi:tetratricopeptide (TPR) repeat protein
MRAFLPAAIGLVLAVRPAPAEEKWHEASSENFVLMTNASLERAESIVLTLEQFRAALGQAIPDLRRWTSGRTRIYGFRDRESLQPFLPPSEPSGSRVKGYFRKGAFRNVIVLDLTGGTPAFERILFHEYVHLVLSLSERDLPLWLEEGLSEFYAGARLGENEVEIGVSDPRHRALLARLPLLPLDELLSKTEVDDSSALFYAQSWALVHYLLVDAPEGRERLSRFLALHVRGVEPVAAFREALGAEPVSLEEELRTYLKRSRLPGVKVAVFPAGPEGAVSRRLFMAEVQQRWGELFLATSRLREARVCFEEAVRLDPELGPAWESLGELELETGEPARASDHFEKAIALGSASASGLYRYAENLLADYRGRVDSIPAPVAEKAGKALRRSLALEPAARSPAELLAFLYLVRGERLDEAEGLVDTALAVSPGEPSLLFLRGQLLAKQGHYDRAREILKLVVETSADSRLREEAEEFLARMSAVQKAPGK